MDWSLFILFVVLSVFNVVLQTVKSIATIKCGKMVASAINAIAYGLYTFVIIYTNCELNIWLKAFVTAMANFVGVYAVKYFEEKNRKDRLWKIEVAVPTAKEQYVVDYCEENGIEFDYLTMSNGFTKYEMYSPTQEVSAKLKNLLTALDAKPFVTEQNAIL